MALCSKDSTYYIWCISPRSTFFRPNSSCYTDDDGNIAGNIWMDEIVNN